MTPRVPVVLGWLVAIALAAVLPTPSGGEGPEPVDRIAGADRDGTTAALAVQGWSSSEVAVLIDSGAPVEALVGAHLAARLDVPVLGGSTTRVAPSTRDALAALDVRRVIAVGGVLAPDDVEVVHLTGGDPVDLAVRVLEAHPGDAAAPTVLVADRAAADMTAAANLAPARLLLTDGGSLSREVASHLEAHPPDQLIVLGGEAAIGPGVVAEVEAMGIAVRRVAGSDRVATALAAVRAGAGTLVVASAAAPHDALAAVPWVARRQAALLLSGHDVLPVEVDRHVRTAGHEQAVLVGGTGALGTMVERGVLAALAGDPAPGFVGAIRPLGPADVTAMTGTSWHDGCPVPLADLRIIDASHWDMGGDVVDDGVLVVHHEVAEDVLDVLGIAFAERWRIARMRPAHEFGGDDQRLMAGNVTSAFNCRTVAGSTRWSSHAYGTAIDVNPVQNPYVRGTHVEPEAGRGFLDRTDVRPGMLVEGDPLLAAFDAIGWGWGGRWQSAKDHQHVSRSGT